MSDTINTILSDCMDFLFILVMGYCLQYFAGSFLESRQRQSRFRKTFFIFLYTALYKIKARMLPPTSNYENLNYESLRILINIALSACIIVILTMCFYKAAHRITVFIIVTFQAVSEISFLCVNLIIQFERHLINLFAWCLEKGYIHSLDLFMNLVEVSGWLALLILYAGTVWILYTALKKIVGYFREKDYAIHKTELLFLLLPSVTGLLFCVLLRVIMITIEDRIPIWLYDKYPLLLLVVPVILTCSLLSIIYGVKLFQDMISFNQERNNRIILNKQIIGMQAQIEEMDHINSGIRSMKHDMKNTLSIIMQLAAKEDTKNTELQTYLTELNQAFDRLDFRYRTGNMVVDTILNMKNHEINRSLPDLHMDADGLIFPESLLIQSYDIGIILGNALDNAIEACAKLREGSQDAELFIRLSSFVKGQMIFLEIENSFDGKIVQKDYTEFPITNKENKEIHGIGLTGIKNAAEKYHGAVDWTVNNRIFTLSVMMRNERSMEGSCI